MKALILGTGSMGSRHMATLAQIGDSIEFIVVRKTGLANEITQKFGARVYSDLSKALDERPHFAIIATPSAFHFEAMETLEKAQVPFYVEKPVAVNEEGLKTLTSRVKASGLVTMVGCNLRFLPSLEVLRQIVLSGACGRIVRGHLEAGQWLPDWHPGSDYRQGYSARRDLGGGVYLDLIHEVDMARWIFGEFDRVRAFLGKFSSLEIETEDVAGILLTRENGPILTLALDYVSRLPIRQYRIIGTEGLLEWDLPNRILRKYDAKNGWIGIKTDSESFDVSNTYVKAMRHFLECVQMKRPSAQSLHEGIKTLSIVLRMIKDSKERR